LALTQAELESAIIGKNASQIRKMEKLTEEELARYLASSGTTKASLKGPAGGF
jgi:DNA-binding transcriptional regulator YiaG